MKTKLVDTIASDEEHVRMRIYDGDLKIDEAVQELLDIERKQHAATRKDLLFYQQLGRDLAAEIERLRADGRS